MNCLSCHAANPHATVGPDLPRLYDPSHTAGFKTNSRTEVRTPFDCRVEKVFVKVGQPVKKGDPLLDLKSIELQAAKIDYRMALNDLERAQSKVHWARDMHAKGYATANQTREAQNVEDQCKVRVQRTKDKLLTSGWTEEEVKGIPKENDEALARFTLRSPTDGQVTRIAAEPEGRYNGNMNLMVIESSSPARQAGE